MDNSKIICDNCQKPILKPSHGWVQWLSTPEDQYYGFKITHNKSVSPKKDYNENGCYFYRTRIDLNDLSLDRFSGIDGMAFLIGMSVEYTSKKGVQRFLDHEEFARLLMRLHLPYYEKASHLFDLESLSDKRKAYSPSRMKHLLQCAA
jgi:hypothetical protein